MNWELFLTVFSLIFIAELPDKTAMAVLLLATRRHPTPVWIGASIGFAVQSAIAVAFGRVLSRLPAQWVHWGAGLLFIGFGISMWFKKEESDEAMLVPGSRAAFHKTVWAAFTLIFLMEWGDLTQLATATLAARHHAPITIFVSATVALSCVSALAAYAGHKAKLLINPRLAQRAGAVAFALVGVFLLLR